MKSLKVIVVIAVLVVVIAGTTFSVLYTHGLSGLMPKEFNSDGKIKVACVGDSVTYGHGIKGWPGKTYPAVLSDLLGSDYAVQNFGVSGTTVQNDGDQPYTQTKQYKLSMEYNPDVIIFMLGSNDSKPYNWNGADKFKEALSERIDEYRNKYPEARFIVGVIPEAHHTDKNKGEEETSFHIQPGVVDEIANIIHEVATEKGLETADVHQLTENHRDLFIYDAVHPNNDGAKAIAELMQSYVIK